MKKAFTALKKRRKQVLNPGNWEPEMQAAEEPSLLQIEKVGKSKACALPYIRQRDSSRSYQKPNSWFLRKPAGGKYECSSTKKMKELPASSEETGAPSRIAQLKLYSSIEVTTTRRHRPKKSSIVNLGRFLSDTLITASSNEPRTNKK
jgi:hypothetical protein